MIVASTPVENIGIGGVLIVETLNNGDHYVVEPVSQRRVSIVTRATEPIEAHQEALEMMGKAWFCRAVHNSICEI